MAKICQVSGKTGNKAKHIRHRHSGQWKFRAPKKNRTQDANLQRVTINTPNGNLPPGLDRPGGNLPPGLENNRDSTTRLPPGLTKNGKPPPGLNK